MTNERDRLDEVYGEYDGGRWSKANRGYAALADERREALADAVADALHALPDPAVLDLGCGDGADQSLLAEALGDRGTLAGVELRFDALVSARDENAGRLLNANAMQLPFANATFDLVLMATMLSSVLDDDIRHGIAAEVDRVLKPGGRVLVYDMRYPNPQNREVRPITKRELASLFPRLVADSRSLSVIPQLSRALPEELAAGLYAAARRVPALRSHRLTVLRKPRADIRVAHVTSSHPPTDPRIYIKEVGALREGGYDVILVAPGADRDALADNDFVPLRVRTSRFGRWVMSWPTTYFRVNRIDPDVIHFHDPDLFPVAVAWKLSGRKVIYDAHESLAKDLAHKPYLSERQSRILAPVIGWAERSIAGRITHTIAATPAIAGQWEFPATVVANYPLLDEWQAIDSSWESYSARADQGCYVGVIHPERCTDTMVAAARILAEQTQGSVVLAGPVPEDDEPRGPGVSYAGVLSRPEVADLMESSRFGLVIFRPAPNIEEALPTKVLEYMAGGLPVVISSSLKVGSRLVGEADCGLVVDHDDVQALAEAMTTLLSDPEAAWQMGQRGREAVTASYSWRTEADHLVEAYERHVGVPHTAGTNP